MTTNHVRTLGRDCEARRRAGDLKKTIFRDLIRDGMMVPPVRVSPRCSAWVLEEIDAINAARIAGKSDEAIRKLVAELVEARKGLSL